MKKHEFIKDRAKVGRQVIRARDKKHKFTKDRAKFSRQVIRARDEETQIHQRQGEGWQAGNQST
jgi:hypothetical protein